MAFKADFPEASTFTATTLGVMAVGYVLAGMAPHVRAFRDVQRAWQAAKTASVDAMKKLERVQESMVRAQGAIGELKELEPDSIVRKFRRAKNDVVRFVDDLDLVVLALETTQQKVSALRRHRPQLTKLAPDFDNAMQQFDLTMSGLDELRSTAEQLREGNLIEQLDAAVQLAIDGATAYALTRSRELAASSRRPSVADALGSLQKIHDFAKAQGVKLGG